MEKVCTKGIKTLPCINIIKLDTTREQTELLDPFFVLRQKPWVNCAQQTKKAKISR